MFKIDVVTDDDGWYNFDDDTKFQVIPFNFSLISLGTENDIAVTLKAKFMYCLTDWEGLIDAKGKAFKYSEYNKEYLYNYYDEIREFVFERSDIKNDKREEK